MFWLICPEEGQRTYQPKRDYNNKDEINSPNILSNNNYQASPQKFRQISILNIFLETNKKKSSFAWLRILCFFFGKGIQSNF